MANKYEITINGITVGAPTQAEAIEIAKALMSEAPKSKKATGAKAQPKAEKVEFVKHDGTKVMCTPKQAKAWEAYRNREFKPLDEVKAEWEAKHKAYKPSKELKEAIKADRASITLAVAKEQYGFVGTKAELKALKDKVLAK